MSKWRARRLWGFALVVLCAEGMGIRLGKGLARCLSL